MLTHLSGWMHFYDWAKKSMVTVLCLSAQCSPHGHDDEWCWLMAERPRVLPEATRPDPRQRSARWGRGICAHRGGLPHLQLHVGSHWKMSLVVEKKSRHNRYSLYSLCLFLGNTALTLVVLWFSALQAIECAIWQKILHGNTLWSLQEEKKVLHFIIR